MGKKFTNTKDFDKRPTNGGEPARQRGLEEPKPGGRGRGRHVLTVQRPRLRLVEMLANLQEQLEAQQAAVEAEAAAGPRPTSPTPRQTNAYDPAADEGSDVSGDGGRANSKGSQATSSDSVQLQPGQGSSRHGTRPLRERTDKRRSKTMATGDADGTAFSAKMIEQLAGGVPGADPNTTLMAGQQNPCSFDRVSIRSISSCTSSATTCRAGPSPRTARKGVTSRTYADSVSQVRRPLAESDSRAAPADLATLQQKIIDYNDGIEQIRMGSTGPSSRTTAVAIGRWTSCATWMPGANAQDFAAS